MSTLKYQLRFNPVRWFCSGIRTNRALLQLFWVRQNRQNCLIEWPTRPLHLIWFCLLGQIGTANMRRGGVQKPSSLHWKVDLPSKWLFACRPLTLSDSPHSCRLFHFISVQTAAAGGCKGCQEERDIRKQVGNNSCK